MKMKKNKLEITGNVLVSMNDRNYTTYDGKYQDMIALIDDDIRCIVAMEYKTDNEDKKIIQDIFFTIVKGETETLLHKTVSKENLINIINTSKEFVKNDKIDELIQVVIKEFKELF